MAPVFDISEKVGAKTNGKTPAYSGNINEFSKVTHHKNVTNNTHCGQK